ncbi:Uncharacterised protein [Acinetobacter baumannii]|nr:Uncharacterised protein [Acinetobacter baumannii]
MPPNFSGLEMPSRPSSPALRKISWIGKRPSFSHWSTLGLISRSTKLRTVRRSSSCSWVKIMGCLSSWASLFSGRIRLLSPNPLPSGRAGRGAVAGSPVSVRTSRPRSCCPSAAAPRLPRRYPAGSRAACGCRAGRPGRRPTGWRCRRARWTGCRASAR